MCGYEALRAQRVGNAFPIAEPKTAASRRRIDLPMFAIEALKTHRQRCPGVAGALVFRNNSGTIIRPSNLVNRNFKPLLKQADLSAIRFHDLRHTAATLWLIDGIHPKVVQERLGHAGIAITLDLYSHVVPSLQRQVAERIDAIFMPTVTKVGA